MQDCVTHFEQLKKDFYFYNIEDNKENICPKCGSTNVERTGNHIQLQCLEDECGFMWYDK